MSVADMAARFKVSSPLTTAAARHRSSACLGPAKCCLRPAGLSDDPGSCRHPDMAARMWAAMGVQESAFGREVESHMAGEVVKGSVGDKHQGQGEVGRGMAACSRASVPQLRTVMLWNTRVMCHGWWWWWGACAASDRSGGACRAAAAQQQIRAGRAKPVLVLLGPRDNAGEAQPVSAPPHASVAWGHSAVLRNPRLYPFSGRYVLAESTHSF